MANKSFVVQYLIKAKNSFSAEAKKASRSFKEITKESKKAAKSMKNMDKESRKAARGFRGSSSTFVTGFKNMAGAAIGFLSVSSLLGRGSEFQTAMADLSAITGAVGKDFDQLQTKTLEMSKQFIVSQKDVATAIKLVGSAKPELLGNIEALTDTTKQVLLLSNAAGIDLETAALVTTESLNQFGKGAEQAGKFVNILAAGAKFGSSEIRNTGEAAVIAGPGARAAGLSFLQLNAAIQTVAKGGIKGSQAGTALNSIFGRLRRQGLDFKKLGLEGVFRIVKREIDKTTDSTARAKLEAKLFGEEHAKVGLALLDNVSDLGMFEKSLSGTNTAQEQAAVRLATFSKQAQKVKIIIDDALIKTFLRLEPMITRNAKAFGEFLAGVDSSQIDAFADSIGILVKALSVLGFFMKETLGLFKGVGNVIGQGAAALATFDFSQFNLKDAFRIGSPDLLDSGGKTLSTTNNRTLEASSGLNTTSRVDVGVNVGLAEGLQQQGKATVGSSGARSANLGLSTAGS